MPAFPTSYPLVPTSFKGEEIFALSDDEAEKSPPEVLDMASSSSGSEGSDSDSDVQIQPRIEVKQDDRSKSKKERKRRGGSLLTKRESKKAKKRQEWEERKAKQEAAKADRFKPECKFWINGACNKGDQCPFAHIGVPQKSAELCKFYMMNACRKGDECMYSHDLKSKPCKFFHFLSQGCSDAKCPFSHDPVTAEQKKAFWEEEALKQHERGQARAAQLKDSRTAALEKIAIFQPFGASEAVPITAVTVE